MTREQAVKVVMDRYAKLSFAGPLRDDLREVAESDVDNFVALGILKLDEPKSAREKFIARMKAYNYGDASCGMKDALGAFDYAVGLQTGTK